MRVEQELDLCVLYAIGDADGPLAGEVKIGLSGRKSYVDEMKTIRAYRSFEVATRLEVIIRGRARGELLKTSLLTRLRAEGRARRGAWFAATAGEIGAMCATVAANDRVQTMTHAEAQLLEHVTFDRIAAKYLGGV